MSPRAIALAAVTVVVLAACAPAEDLAGDLQATIGDAVSEVADAASEALEAAEGATRGDGGSGGGTDGAGGDPGGGSAGTGGGADAGSGAGSGGGSGQATGGGADAGGADRPAAATPADDRGPVGANGRAYLRGDRSRLVVEVDVQEGAALDQAALDHLAATIRQVADKPDGVTFAGGNTFASDRRTWTAADLRSAAEANRQHHSDDATAVIHVLVVRGGFHRDGSETEAIGVAYHASGMAIFPDRYAGLTGVLGSPRAIARAVLVHELGHLLGLVNLTYRSEIAHEDPDHPGHSANRGSVMYYAIETTLIGQVFSGPPPDSFDADDLADLEGLRTGRY